MSNLSAQAPLESVPLLIDGRWEQFQTDEAADVYNPSTGAVIARTPLCGPEEATAAVEAAAGAVEAWSQTPVVERAQLMFRFRELLISHFDELVALVTREHGKTLVEAAAEVNRGQELLEFACGIPSLYMGRSLANIAAEVDAETVRHPIGVCVGITPFNFPNMVPLWMFPVAVTCGNTFILKPSEKVPLSAIRLGELMLEAGFPPGVFNIVHGDKRCVDVLLTHPKVAAISFVGSTPIARSIYQTGTRHGKRVQAAGGAKNHMIIMPDADLDLSVKGLAGSAYGCTGQRCMAGSVAVAVGDVADPLLDQLCTHSKSIRVGATDGNPDVEMGPINSPAALQRVHGYVNRAAAQGATLAVDGCRPFDGDGFLVGPSVIDHVRPHMELWTDEIFGPVLSVVRVDSLDDALALGTSCSYGNGASIFTRDGYAARQFKHHFNAGMIGINVGVPAPMAWMPFTGWNQSFFGDLHIQGIDSVHFYTRQKVTMTRWFKPTGDTHHDPVWKTR